MKNFKLLLATTAILSMGLAIDAVALNETDITVSIDFVSSAAVSKVQDMNFGKVSFINGTGNTVLPGTITLTPSGEVSYTDMEYYGQAKQAIVSTGASDTGKVLSFPSSITLKNGSKECGMVDNFTTGAISYGECGGQLCRGTGIGATFTLTATGEGETPRMFANEQCTGTLHVTMIIPEPEPEP